VTRAIGVPTISPSMNRSILMFLCAFAVGAVEPVALQFENLQSIEGSVRWDWWQVRTAFVPGKKPMWITTMSETGKGSSHDFHDIFQSVSRDGGRSWSKPSAIASLKRTEQADGYEVSPGDLWPTRHAKSGKVLTTGKTFNFAEGKRENRLREKVSYAVMNPNTGAWGPMRFLKMPAKDHSGATITGANAGCTQRVDLPNGDILLPVRYCGATPRSTIIRVSWRCVRLMARPSLIRSMDRNTISHRVAGFMNRR